MSDLRREELLRVVVEEAMSGRKSWQQDYLVPLTDHGITFKEVQDEVARRREDSRPTGQGRSNGEPILTPEQLFTVPGMVLTVAAVAIVYFASDAIYKTVSIPHWPTTTGTVTGFSDWSEGWVTANPNFRRSYAGAFWTRALLGYHLHYHYSAANGSYDSTSVRIGPTNPADEEKYPQNSPVTVYYNPQNPAEAYLENTIAIPWGPIMVIGFFGSFLAIVLSRSIRGTL
jgi:hypothetical protein